MKASKSATFTLITFFLLATVSLLGCSIEEKLPELDIPTETTTPPKETETTETETEDSSNDNSNTTEESTSTEEKELVLTFYDEEGNSTTEITRFQFEEGRIVKEIFPDLAAGVEGKYQTITYSYNDNDRITSISLTDEFETTEDLVISIAYEEDIITNISDNKEEGLRMEYESTNADGQWLYKNDRGETGLIAFDAQFNWTHFQAKAVSDEEASLFFTNSYELQTPGFYPEEPKYFSFLSWITQLASFKVSAGVFMSRNLPQSYTEFWSSARDYNDQSFENGLYQDLIVVPTFENNILVKLTLRDKETDLRVQEVAWN